MLLMFSYQSQWNVRQGTRLNVRANPAPLPIQVANSFGPTLSVPLGCQSCVNRPSVFAPFLPDTFRSIVQFASTISVGVMSPFLLFIYLGEIQERPAAEHGTHVPRHDLTKLRMGAAFEEVPLT